MNLIKPYLAAHDDSLAVGELGILDCDVPEVDFSLRLDRVKIANVIVNVIVDDNVKIPFFTVMLCSCRDCLACCTGLHSSPIGASKDWKKHTLIK